MVYEDHEIPYFKNLVDQYRSMVKYNRGYSYNMIYVGPGWMSKNGRWEADYATLLKTYQDIFPQSDSGAGVWSVVAVSANSLMVTSLACPSFLTAHK